MSINENAQNIANLLLESKLHTICAACEQEHGTVQVPTGDRKSHSLCKRHLIEKYRELRRINPDRAREAHQMIKKIQARPDSEFPVDMSTSTIPGAATFGQTLPKQ